MTTIAEADSGNAIGMILWRFRNRLTESLPEWSVFNHIDPSHFDTDGRFCEIFQLWVDPRYRRQGIASKLKKAAESESIRRGIRTIYTHTESINFHVIDLNIELGYSEVRRGPIWDDIERISLIKHLA
jgi:ribosomal protein S18 acetylase RimI-like enzyme